MPNRKTCLFELDRIMIVERDVEIVGTHRRDVGCVMWVRLERVIVSRMLTSHVVSCYARLQMTVSVWKPVIILLKVDDPCILGLRLWCCLSYAGSLSENFAESDAILVGNIP